MKYKTSKILGVIAVVILLLAHTTVMSQGTDRTGTASFQQLMIPIGARYLAAGGTNLAYTEGVESIYWNPAGLSAMESTSEVMFSYMPYIADIGVTYLGVGVDLGRLGTVGATMKSIGIGEIDVTTVDMPDGTGESFSPTFFTLGLTYSNKLTDRVNAGVTINIVNESFPRASAVGMAVDAGIQYKDFGNIKGLGLGVVLKNLGPNVKYDGPGLYRNVNDLESRQTSSQYKIAPEDFGLPTFFDLSLSYKRNINEFSEITGAYVFQNNNYSVNEHKAGVEFSYKDMVYVRGGYSMAESLPADQEYIYGPTFGAGVTLQTGNVMMFVDYAYRYIDYFDSSNIFSLKIGF